MRQSIPPEKLKERYHARAVVSIPLRCLVIDKLDSLFSASMSITLLNPFSKARFFWHGFWPTRVLLSAGIGINNIGAILNKVPSDDIASKLEAELAERGIDMIGCVNYDSGIFQSCLEGLTLGKGSAGKEIRDVFDLLVSRAKLGH